MYQPQIQPSVVRSVFVLKPRNSPRNLMESDSGIFTPAPKPKLNFDCDSDRMSVLSAPKIPTPSVAARNHLAPRLYGLSVKSAPPWMYWAEPRPTMLSPSMPRTLMSPLRYE